MSIPVECLENLQLDNGWTVTSKITKRPENTGGNFSSGYIVQKGEIKAFLKAFDFSVVLNYSPDKQPEILNQQLEIFNFEKELLEKCKNSHMNKIVIPIDSGSVQINGFPDFFGRVYYIIFELADGNIRNIQEQFTNLDLAFIFRSLHNIAVGINQLHHAGIAHQDIKPSNALVFKNETKLSDLGRASDASHPFLYDDGIPGDQNYSAIEQFYNFRAHGDITDRFAADLYTFGSLFFFYFGNLSFSTILIKKLQDKKILSGTNSFETDLPGLIRIYEEIMIDFNTVLLNYVTSDVAEQITNLVKSLCHPDPRQRGHRKNIAQGFSQYSLERYITEINILAEKAELKLIK